MGFDDELWWQNLEEWIFDDSMVVTYKYVAASLKVHVNAAKKMLYTFHEESGRKTFAIYLIAGNIDGECHIRLVADKDIDEYTSKLDQILTKHVYALGQESAYDKANLSGILQLGKETNQLADILPHRGIVCDKSLQVREDSSISSEPPTTEVKKEKDDSTVIVKESSVKEAAAKKGSVKSMFAKAPAKKEKLTEERSEAENPPQPKEPAAKKTSVKEVTNKATIKKPSGGKSNAIKSMFANAPPKKEKSADEKCEAEDPTQPKPDSPGKENKANQGSSYTSTDEPEVKRSKDTNRSTGTKRRKRIQVMSSSDSSENEDSEPNNDENMQVRTKKLKSSNFAILHALHTILFFSKKHG